MINVSSEFKQTMQTRTDFKEYAEITLVDGTVIKLDDSQFTVTNNSVTDGAALSSVPIGVAVQKIAQLEVLNDQEQWVNYDFFGAKVHLYMTFALSGSTEKVERGLYTVTTPETYGETVIITAYDDMYKADKNYSTTLSFPNTLKNMLIDICQTCSIPLLSTTFPHDDFTIPTKPDGQYTYRQIISYIAMLAGGNARINNAGYLEIITYSSITSNTYYGNLTGIETGAPEHVLSSWQSLTMDKNDITVTGVALKIDTQDGQEKRFIGTDGYVITVYNPLVNASDETTLATAMHNISEHLVGLKFRKFDGVSVSNPLIEFMDFVAVKDRRGRLYQSFVTDITFTFLGSSTIKNSAESAVRTETVYAGNVNTEIRMRKLVEAEKSARELAVSNLSNALANSSGLYETAEVQPDGSTIYYLHDKPTLAESKSVIKLTAEAIGLSTDGGKTYPYGFTITGEMVTRLLAAEGINADWIKTGALTISDESGNEIFNADLDKKTVNMASTRVTIDGKTFNSRIAESVTDFNLSPLNQLSGSKNLKDDRYYLTSDIYALAGRAIVGQHVLRSTSSIADWPDTTVPDGSTDSVLRLVDCTGISYRLVGISIETGKTYTFSVRVRADSTTTVKFSALGNAAQTENVGTDWSTITITCVAQANTVLISPVEDGAVYLYHAMLQAGEIPTAWTPNTKEDTEKITALTQKYSEMQQDVDGIRTEVGRVEQEGKNTYATKTEMNQTASSIRTDVENQVTGAKSYTDQQVDSITLNVTDPSGGTTSIAITADHKINIDGDVLANCISVAQLFAKDITVSGNFTIDNGEYFLGSNFAIAYPDGTSVTYPVALFAADGRNSTYLGLSKTGIALVSSNSVSIETGLSGGLLIDGKIAATLEDIGLWGFTDLPSGADLNDYTACGYYKYSYDEGSFTIKNSPAKAAFTMRVWNSCGYEDNGIIEGYALRYRLQKLTTWQGDEYVRQAYTDSSGSVTFSAWKSILNTGSALGSWTPTVSGAASYTAQTGRYIKIGDMAVVTFSVYGTFAGSTTGRIKVSGCPLTPADNITSGGGHLSGYTAASNIIFTGWNTSTNGSFYAVGQETATTGSNKWGSEAIYQKASGEFSASGTIAFRTN